MWKSHKWVENKRNFQFNISVVGRLHERLSQHRPRPRLLRVSIEDGPAHRGLSVQLTQAGRALHPQPGGRVGGAELHHQPGLADREGGVGHLQHGGGEGGHLQPVGLSLFIVGG